MAAELLVRPIGFVRSPFAEKVEAPRQGILAEGVEGSIELLPEYADALDDLAAFDRVWILFWFHRAEGWKPKVLPPRSEVKRGLFATRSPHRPNPIGITAARLERVDGLTVHVRDHDLVDGTPVLDLKPYIPYADAFPDAGSGWLGAPPDAKESWAVAFEPAAEEQLAWVQAETGLDLRARAAAALSLGPQPHAYRRIKGNVLAVKEWRLTFRSEPDEVRIVVERVTSGYRPKELPSQPAHRAFVARFG
ncbi:MAG: tRNA (N6-threonylcarbamoyladenosine(37)-N6)-methyltransferase TrmO [Labilithrix sp.]|nr:tRNA (N6-threonylcarbamoyladenosine(37)-N6)-methyltransferase TrmO [Labilithrix sp.]MCW5813542.1 tRNA (N6-threonylcarbamoyladenosine(37)-N6)-methyltransferase TrmO [Labilithrix sp.]